jgi:hypothetical protein
MFGEGGSDLFYARDDGEQDEVDGGSGRDSALIDDGIDILTSIERQIR